MSQPVISSNTSSSDPDNYSICIMPTPFSLRYLCQNARVNRSCFQLSLKILNWFNIWVLACSLWSIDILIHEPCLGKVWLVFWVTVFLEGPLMLQPKFSARLFDILVQNLNMIFFLHDPIHFNQATSFTGWKILYNSDATNILGTVFFGLKVSSLFRQTKAAAKYTRSSIFASSDQRIDDQNLKSSQDDVKKR